MVSSVGRGTVIEGRSAFADLEDQA